MSAFNYVNGRLKCDDVFIEDVISACNEGKFYLYSLDIIERNISRVRDALSSVDYAIHFSIKTLNNLYILKKLAALGCSFDCVSGGEVFKALSAGASPDTLVYAGVGKSLSELEYAIVCDVGLINVESLQELERLEEICERLDKTCRVALRINPQVYDKKTHYSLQTGKAGTKFGIDLSDSGEALLMLAGSKRIVFNGFHFHLGSPIYDSRLLVQALSLLGDLIYQASKLGLETKTLNVGGGLPPDDLLSDEEMDWAGYYGPVLECLENEPFRGRKLLIEPGRGIVQNAGCLVSKVEYTKQSSGRNIIVVNIGMNDYIRPMLYNAIPAIGRVAVDRSQSGSLRDIIASPSATKSDVVGPICESTDKIVTDLPLDGVQAGDYLVLFGVGAYGSVMSSHYNAHPKVAEYALENGALKCIRRKETYEDIIRLEVGSPVDVLLPKPADYLPATSAYEPPCSRLVRHCIKVGPPVARRAPR